MRKFFLFIFMLVLLAGFALYVVFSFLTYRNSNEVELSIPKGVSVAQIARMLEEKEVIPSMLGFRLLVRVTQKGSHLKAGDYLFEEGLKPLEVLEIIASGRVELLSVTVPEGQNLKQIFSILKKSIFNQLNENDWNELITQEKWIKKFSIPTKNLEGYLFPSTYHYGKDIKPVELIDSMLTTFSKQVNQDMIEQAKSYGFNLHQWVTLASIIEKETGVPKERPMIARVFMNRLRLGMLLQTDPTVIYGIENFNGNLRRTDLETDTPYNTYMRPGLPPGPICSPGLESLKAVLNPAEGDYLYFVAKGDGSHHFSKTLEEHNKAVNFYQRHQGVAPINQ